MHKKIILNAQTGEIIEREMTAPEEAEHLERIKKAEFAIKTETAAQIAKVAARQALLDRLGLTEQEAQLLLGS